MPVYRQLSGGGTLRRGTGWLLRDKASARRATFQEGACRQKLKTRLLLRHRYIKKCDKNKIKPKYFSSNAWISLFLTLSFIYKSLKAIN